MNYFVAWNNGQYEVVERSELRSVKKGEKFGEGTCVKMYNNKWFYGKIVSIFDEENHSDSSDELPLSHHQRKVVVEEQSVGLNLPTSPYHKTTDNEAVTEESNTPYNPSPSQQPGHLLAEEVGVVQDIAITHPHEEQQTDNLSMDVCDQSSNGDFSVSGDSLTDPTFHVSCEIENCKNVCNEYCKNCKLLICTYHLTCTEGSYFCVICKPKISKPLPINHTRHIHHEKQHEQSGICQIHDCALDVFAACVKCSTLVCFEHLHQQPCCTAVQDTQITVNSTTNTPQDCTVDGTPREQPLLIENSSATPQDFTVDGAPREEPMAKEKRINKSKQRKQLRDAGLEYYTLTGKPVAKRLMKPICSGEACEKMGKKCSDFSENDRAQIFNDYWNTGSLVRQREFIIRHVEAKPAKRTYVKSTQSRRQHTNVYSFQLQSKKVNVCKLFFLNTLGISEKTMRTALRKVKPSGVMESENRGGRRGQERIANENIVRANIEEHINKFPRAESHYCRSNTTREYLCHDLTIPLMYHMYRDEMKNLPRSQVGSMTTYRRVFKSLNLSFLSLKKDQCSLCFTYKQGDENKKVSLQSKYDEHILSKQTVRALKNESKVKAMNQTNHLAACFDLQQVIYLPQSKESAIFYKRRLANYNFTIYILGTKDCECFLWNETISRRGSSEIATFVYKFLCKHDEQCVKTADLFADGCSGQNKNSTMAAMLLYFINNSQHIDEITLRFFEPNHGQNEGDSAHSCIGYAIKQAGDLFLPAQLTPVIKLARRSHPYTVNEINYPDVLDFKSVSKTMKLLSLRKDDQTVGSIDWTKMMEYKVTKEYPDKIFFKTAHTQADYKSISIKVQRGNNNVMSRSVPQSNAEPPKISAAKYADLISLCSGDTPVVRVDEYANYYHSLFHE